MSARAVAAAIKLATSRTTQIKKKKRRRRRRNHAEDAVLVKMRLVTSIRGGL
jgi:hypothetical protein